MTSGNKKRVAASVAILTLAALLFLWQSGAIQPSRPGAGGLGPTSPQDLEQRNRNADPRTNPGELQGLVPDII